LRKSASDSCMKFPFAALLIFVSLLSTHAFASLGGDAASVDADVAQMRAGRSIEQAATYTVQQLNTDSGTTVREYVSFGGRVFAVSWQGSFVPDMQQLLGSYFDQYSAAVKANREAYRGRRPLDIQLPGLVVQMTGYARHFHFRAYIPQQVPAGAKLGDIR